MKKTLITILSLFLLSSCNGSDSDSPSDNEGSGSDASNRHRKPKCTQVEDCQEEVYGIPASYLSYIIEENFKEPLTDLSDNENRNMFLCGSKVQEVYLNYVNRSIPESPEAYGLIYQFSETFLDLNTCVYKPDFQDVLLKTVNKN